MTHGAVKRHRCPLMALSGVGPQVVSLNVFGRGSIKKRHHLFRDHVWKFLVHRKLAMRQLDKITFARTRMPL